MATLLGTLRVRLAAETADFKRGLDAARKQTQSFQKELNRFRNNTLAQVASLGAVSMALKSSIDVANQYDNAQRQLAATAKLTGTEFGFLQSTSKAAQDQFKLSAISANGFTIELAKLAGKAGDVGKASAGLEAFLDIGAARGLSADQTLKAVQQSILGIDEGTDKLFSKNPSVLYAEFAAKIGTTAGKLTDQQKAQALLTAAMEDGGKVRGEYQKWLESSQGQQYLLSQGIEQTQATLGKALQPALVAIIPIVSKMAEGVQMAIQGWQMLGATLALVPALAKRAWATLKGEGEKGKEEFQRTLDAWRATIAEIQSISAPTYVPSNLDVSGGAGGASGVEAAGRKTAAKFYSGLEDEWERLRHSVALRQIEVTGTEPQRLALEEAHALRMLDIEEQHIRARHRLGELNAEELQQSLKQLNTRRTLAQATRAQMEGAYNDLERERASFERQDVLLSHRIAKERLLGQQLLTRLDSEGSVEDRMRLQLELVERTYQLRREALLADTRLTDPELSNELLKLDLAKEREEIQLRINAAAEEARKATQRKQDNAALRDQAIGMASGMIGAALSGQGVSGSQIGTNLGMLAGHFIPGASAVAPMLGGLLGGLFDKDKDKPEAKENPVIKSLNAIERAQRETITTIKQQTDSLLSPESRLINMPSTFRVPNYAPSIGGGGSYGNSVTYGDTNVTVAVNVSAPGVSPDEIKRYAREGVSEALESGRRNSGWGRGEI